MLAAAGLIVLTAFGVDANHATPVKTVAAPGVTLMDDCTDDSATDDSDDLAQQEEEEQEEEEQQEQDEQDQEQAQLAQQQAGQ